MPKKPVITDSVAYDELVKLKLTGVDSTVLRCRMGYVKANQILTHYLNPIGEQTRIHPSFLPTQASGRWSTTEYPVTNWPKQIRDIVVPDLGTYWIDADWDGIEARVVAALSGDVEDLKAFEMGWDIHTLTACGMYSMPLPPILTKKCHTDPSCEAWRQQWKPAWKGEGDKRRWLAKTTRFGLAYAVDERGVVHAKGIEESGLTVDKLIETGRLYLSSKPLLRRWKIATWDKVLRDREARTFLGRRRKLFVSAADLKKWTARIPPDCAKAGLNHIVQGSVADMANRCIIDITDSWPQCVLKQQRHDGFTFQFPNEVDAWPEIRPMLERRWQLTPEHSITSTASWSRINEDGATVELR